MRESDRALPSGGRCGFWVNSFSSPDRCAAWDDIRLCEQSYVCHSHTSSYTRDPNARGWIRRAADPLLPSWPSVLQACPPAMRKTDEGDLFPNCRPDLSSNPAKEEKSNEEFQFQATQG